MYLSSNTRGSIEATLFYGGWALVGSIFLGVGILYFYNTTQILYFSEIMFHHLTSGEIYMIYMCLFFGFGTKLSTWPFWYWLPRAHVEVSTGMSIFLSCILIKIAYYALLKFHLTFLTEISYFICIWVALIGIFDVILRVLNIKDLKALIAYSSVLHTNLLVILIHLDIYKVCLSSIFYV
jgi:NADH:ubiquinone oxidoreductase subunit 4 (subunit M)